VAVMSLAPAHEAGLPDRVELATLPTPLVAAPRLASCLEIPRLLIKRDDLTGFAIGGNKARSLEFLVASALRQGADTLVTGGAPESNFVVCAAAAARRAGLSCRLVIAGEPSAHAPGLGLARSWGASVTWTGAPDRASVDDALPRAAAELAAHGHRPYAVPRGGATALGAVGFALAAAELHDQLAGRGLRRARVVIAVGSGCTLAGLVAGNALLGWPWRLLGASVSRPPDETRRRVVELAGDCLTLLADAGWADRAAVRRAAFGLRGSRVELVDARGPGHGLASEDGRQAAEVALRAEGLVLDPVYTAKAVATLSRAADDPVVVYWHTGGLLGAFAAATGPWP
jgi:1-aminocyclopropane-1-carboxylate deaminase/D-cysteine desulfhydrase-like pyridoxal-dependent ACC family enzyme